MHKRRIIHWLILVALLAVLAGGRVHAQDPAAPDAEGGDRVLLPFVAGPSIFTAPWPADGAERQSLNAFLTWHLDSPAWAGATFNVLLEPDNSFPTQLQAVGLTKAAYDPYTFAEDTVYYWQVVAELADGTRSVSPIWHFRTDYFPQQPEVGSMVYVPEGEFQMGCDPNNSGFECFSDESPLHPVWLDAFYLDKYQITNVEYAACMDAGACNAPRKDSVEGHAYFGKTEYAYFPVLYISRWDAQDYCEWVGKRLPTEAEWEKAARGSIDTRPWPWGSEPWDCTNMNRCRDSSDWFPVRVDDMHRGQTPYGALNMAGNAADWLQDFYNPDYYKWAPYRNPVNTREWEEEFDLKRFSIRGGGFHDNWFYSRTTHRKFGHWGDWIFDDKPLYRSFRVSFRCASSSAP